MFIVYDRLNISVDTLLNSLNELFKTHNLKLRTQYYNLNKWTPGFGQIFLILDYND